MNTLTQTGNKIFRDTLHTQKHSRRIVSVVAEWQERLPILRREWVRFLGTYTWPSNEHECTTWPYSQSRSWYLRLVSVPITLQSLMPHCKGIWQIYEISHSLCKPFEIGMLCFIAHRPVTYKGTKPVYNVCMHNKRIHVQLTYMCN